MVKVIMYKKILLFNIMRNYFWFFKNIILCFWLVRGFFLSCILKILYYMVLLFLEFYSFVINVLFVGGDKKRVMMKFFFVFYYVGLEVVYGIFLYIFLVGISFGLCLLEKKMVNVILGWKVIF